MTDCDSFSVSCAAWLSALADDLSSRGGEPPVDTGELVPSDTDAPPLTIPSSFAHSATVAPLAPALTDGLLCLTYRQLQGEVSDLSHALAPLVSAGDRVALQLPRSAEYVVLYLAVLSLGAVVVPLSPDLSAHETGGELLLCEPVLLLCEPRAPDARPGRRADATDRVGGTPAAAAPAVVYVPVRARADGALTELRTACGAVAVGCAPQRRVDPAAAAVLLATSGSYGLPKRVVLSHTALLASARAHRASLGLTGGHEVALAVVPLNFGYCNTVQLVGQFDSGGHLVLLDGDFLPSRFGRLIERHGVTSTLLVPAMLRLLTLGDWDRAYDLHSLRHIVYGGAATSQEILDRIEERLPGVELVETYGQTEAGPRVTTMRRRDRHDRPGSVGRALPGIEVSVRDKEFGVLPAGRSGEIAVRGPGVMTGYYDRPEESAQVLRDGWLRTGDLGRLDEDGFLYLRGRLRNIAIVSGMNVSLEEVEAALTAHPAVAEAVCAVRADARAGETLVAWVRLAPDAHGACGRAPEAGAPDRQATVLKEVIGFCRDRLSAHKRPRRIEAVAEFPRTRTGKIDRSALHTLSRDSPAGSDVPARTCPKSRRQAVDD
ncbi:class I adenylate-forming enzyme family protein [Streptomyces anulatus]|uniref:class I adenylate-forming enzyme family protein n=1 Tax=Streptomyces anulatus TaxID=1892 RepID=UPI003431F4EB